jgi:Ca2+/H+ antiporter, TMEM165/GDT1 family
MEAFLISISTVAIAEMGDRTQFLVLALAAHYRRPWPIVAGVLCATVVNHAVAGFVGARLGHFLTPGRLDAIVGMSLIGMAIWTLKPETLDQGETRPRRSGAFVATCIAFFIAEIGDKTQFAVMALGAAYPNLIAVVSGTTLGILTANVPVIFLGHAFSSRLPLKAIRALASVLFLVVGALFLWRAFVHG